MNQEEYGLMVAKLAKDPALIQDSLTVEKVDLMHAAIGICGEAGELLDAIKKHFAYDKELDVENIIEELGDMEFYMELLRRRLLITRAATLTHNHNKLMKKRYPNGYSDQAAIERADKTELIVNEAGRLEIATEKVVYGALTNQQLVDGWNHAAKQNDQVTADEYKFHIKRRGMKVHMEEIPNPDTLTYENILVITEPGSFPK